MKEAILASLAAILALPAALAQKSQPPDQRQRAKAARSAPDQTWIDHAPPANDNTPMTAAALRSGMLTFAQGQIAGRGGKRGKVALEKCKACGNDVSIYVYLCPHCGYPLRATVGTMLAVGFAAVVLAVELFLITDVLLTHSP